MKIFFLTVKEGKIFSPGHDVETWHDKQPTNFTVQLDLIQPKIKSDKYLTTWMQFFLFIHYNCIKLCNFQTCINRWRSLSDVLIITRVINELVIFIDESIFISISKCETECTLNTWFDFHFDNRHARFFSITFLESFAVNLLFFFPFLALSAITDGT